MNLMNFIVLDSSDKLKENKIGHNLYEYTVSGEVFINLETAIPVIQQGKGCVGLGLVKKLTITKNSTTIEFTCDQISNQAAEAYYSLYRTNTALGNDDSYDSQDVLIPGAMATATSITNADRQNGGYRRSRRNDSLSDYL